MAAVTPPTKSAISTSACKTATTGERGSPHMPTRHGTEQSQDEGPKRDEVSIANGSPRRPYWQHYPNQKMRADLATPATRTRPSPSLPRRFRTTGSGDVGPGPIDR